MNYWNRGLISSARRNPTAFNASGVHDLESQLLHKRQGDWPVSQTASLTTDGLALHLDAGDSSSYSGSGTTWYDLTSNNVDFTLINGPTYSSSDGGYFNFDGSNDHAVSTNWTNFGTGLFSIEIWHYVDTFNTFEGLLGTDGNGEPANNDNSWQISFSAQSRITLVSEIFVSTYNIDYVGKWVQTVFVREKSTSKVSFDEIKSYRNGSQSDKGYAPANLNSGLQLRVGRSRGAAYFDGRISIVRLYRDKALTAQEVANNFNYNKSRYSS